MFKARVLDVISYIRLNDSFSQWLETFHALKAGMKMMIAEQIPEMDLEVNGLVLRHIPGSHFTISNQNVFFMIALPDQDPEKQHQLDYTEALITELVKLNPDDGLYAFGKNVFKYTFLPDELVLRVIQDVYELTHGKELSKNVRYTKADGLWIPYILSVTETENGEVTLELQTAVNDPSIETNWTTHNVKSKRFPIGSSGDLEVVQLESVLEEG